MRFDEAEARDLDAADPLAALREQFLFPEAAPVYLCGHSLGLQPRRARQYVAEELDAWATLGVEGHFHGRRPWLNYHEWFAAPLARLVGAMPDEVVAMNSLTVNLHLMLATFYRRQPGRAGILIDEPAFPSDRFAAESVIRCAGYDPRRWLVATDDVLGELRRGGDYSVVVFNPVNFLTGRRYDVREVVAAAQAVGCVVGLDCAHAVGNVPLELHDWDVDFAVWCSYKYLNAGPGAVAGCFVHRRHGQNPDLPRLAGWWGHDPATRFRMQLEPRFIPQPGADGWQLSNPPILALAPLRASLELFDEAGMARLREKSLRLTAYLEAALDQMLPAGRVEQLTPREPDERGAMLALRIADGAREVERRLFARGVLVDFREPDVIRVAPAPLYNNYSDAWRFARALAEELSRN
jgi:kynureninase